MNVHIKLTLCPFCQTKLHKFVPLCKNCGVLKIINLNTHYYNNNKTALCGLEVKRG